MDKNDEVIVPIGNAGTAEEPYVTAYMCRVAYEYEVVATTARLFPSVEAHQVGCSCGKWGSVEVAVHFVRYIKSRETELKEEEREHQRGNLEVVVRRIRQLQMMLPVPLVEVLGAKGSEMVDYWLDRHAQNPNGRSLFWALDTLRSHLINTGGIAFEMCHSSKTP